MIDIKFIRNNPILLDASLKIRRNALCANNILDLDMLRRHIVSKLQKIRKLRNRIIKKVGFLKASKLHINILFVESDFIKYFIFYLEKKNRNVSYILQKILLTTPNILDDHVIRESIKDYIEIKTWGDIPSSKIYKNHFEIGENLGLMDFESAARMSGSRFVVLYGQLALLERALSSFMLDIHTKEFGYTEVSVPLLVRYHSIFGTGQLPKFSKDLFQTTDGRWLIPTGEVSLTNLVREQIIKNEDLPLRFCASTPCFRSEAGASGRDTRGMIRQHQFLKVELVSIVNNNSSHREHDYMINAAESILKRLILPYRIVLLSGKDTGLTSKKTHDIEVWLPSSKSYREISSCSIIGTYQSYRMKTRYKNNGNLDYAHTLNGSGVAVGRALVSILENYQQSDGSVIIPEVLVPYMDGVNIINRL